MFWGQEKTVNGPLQHCEGLKTETDDLNFCQIFIIKQKLHFSTLKWWSLLLFESSEINTRSYGWKKCHLHNESQFSLMQPKFPK